MVYALQKYRHYFLGGNFKTYTDHSMLKYLVNKPMFGGRICRWLLLFQEYDFEVVVKLGCLNVGLDHLSQIETGKKPTNLEGLPNAQLYLVRIADGHFEDIIYFLTTGTALQGYFVQQKKELVTQAADFTVITGHPYKMGHDEILCRYVPKFEREHILAKAHGGVASGHYAGHAITHKPQVTLHPFEKWVIDFVGPIELRGKTGERYIITATEYLTQWVEAYPIKDRTATTIENFLFKNVLTRFGCPRILMSDRGMHFLNETINALTEEFKIYHQQSTAYHPKENGTIEAFKKSLETALTKICNARLND
eukprot:PITA_16334